MRKHKKKNTKLPENVLADNTKDSERVPDKTSFHQGAESLVCENACPYRERCDGNTCQMPDVMRDALVMAVEKDVRKTEEKKARDAEYESDIRIAESRLGVSFPGELRSFYKKYGYGSFIGEDYTLDTILSPSDVAKLRLRQDNFANRPELDIYRDYEAVELLFFEQNDDAFFGIEITDKPTQRIFFCGSLIANSLSDFLKMMVGLSVD